MHQKNKEIIPPYGPHKQLVTLFLKCTQSSRFVSSSDSHSNGSMGMRLAQGVLHLWYTSEHHAVEIGIAHKTFHQKSWSQSHKVKRLLAVYLYKSTWWHHCNDDIIIIKM